MQKPVKSYISDELKSLLGRELGRADYEIEKGMIRSLAAATLDENPAYQDSEPGSASQHDGMIAPPATRWPIIPPPMDLAVRGDLPGWKNRYADLHA